MMYKTIHRKLKIEQHEPHWNQIWTQLFLKGKHVNCSCSIYDTVVLLLFTPSFSRVRVMFSFMCMFGRSLYVILSFFFWPLCCLFFDLQILITPLVSPSSFYIQTVNDVNRCSVSIIQAMVHFLYMLHIYLAFFFVVSEFHIECLKPCLQTKQTNCPVCRRIYISVPSSEFQA